MASSLFIKSLSLYEVKETSSVDSLALEKMLDKQAHRTIGPSEKEMCMWFPPSGIEGGTLVFESQGHRLMMLQKHKRKLPASAVKAEVKKKIAEVEKNTGSKILSDQRKLIKEEVKDAMMRRAIVDVSQIPVWWDVEKDILGIGSTSKKTVDDALELLSTSLGSFSVAPIATKNIPENVMTEWLTDPESRPMWLTLGESTVLAGDEGARYSGNNVDLEGEEIGVMLSQGYRVAELRATMPEHASFTLDAGLGLKKIKFEEDVEEEVKNQTVDTVSEQVEGSFLIMVDSLRWVVSNVIESQGGFHHQ